MKILTRNHRNDPFGIHDEVTRLFDELSRPVQRGWLPAVDVRESDEAYSFRIDLPGIDPKQVKIEMSADTLSLKGERKPQVPEKAVRHRQEREFGAFTRTLTLPVNVDPDQVEAKFENGVLRLRLAKHVSAKPRKIQVGGTQEAIPTTMRSDAPAEAPEQRSHYQAPPASTTSAAPTSGQPTETESTQSPGGGTSVSGSPAAVQSEPNYEPQQGADETPAEDPFGLREEERRGDLT